MMNDEAFGTGLARDAAEFLKSERWFHQFNAIVRSHRDYTGHGLFYNTETKEFFPARSDDGIPRKTLLNFVSEETFVAWLAEQSDLSLSGEIPTGAALFDSDPGNQRISRDFLVSEMARRRKQTL